MLYHRFHFVRAEPVPGHTTYRFVSSYMCRQGHRTHRLHGCRFIEKTWIITEQLIYPRSHNYHFKSQTKGQDPRSEIIRTWYQIQDTIPGTIYKYIYVPDTMCLVRGTRLQGTAVVPGAGRCSLWTNRKKYRRKVISCFIQYLLLVRNNIWNISWKNNQTAEVLAKSKWV